MRKCWKWSVLLPYIGITIILNTAWAFAIELGPVTNIHAVSEHEINRPSQATVIEIEWSLPEGYTYDAIEGYYYHFDQSEVYEYDEFYTGEPETSQKAISKDYMNDALNDEFIYFHIAAVALDDNDDPVIGTTVNLGPFRIDTVQPQGVGVTTAPVSYDQSIELSLIAESSNLNIYISNIGFVQSETGWIPFDSKINWTVPEGDGLKTIFVQFRDDAGNISQATATTELITTPSVTLQSPLTSPTNASIITVYANFSQPVTPFNQNDMSVVNATIDQISGSGSAYTIILTPEQDGLVQLTISENAAGGIVSSQLFEVMVDRQSPTLSIQSNIPPYANTASWSIEFSLNESVIGFDESDIRVENANIVKIEPVESHYIATISPAEQGAVTISVLSNSFADAAGNNNAEDIVYMRTYDSNPPVLTLEKETTISLGSEFDQRYSVTAIDYIDGDITDMIDVSGNVDTLTIGEYTLTYSVTDRATNNISITRTVIVEESPFNVAIQSPLSSPTNAQSIPIIVIFDRAVDSFNYSQISLENAQINEVAESVRQYTIVLTPDSDGMVRVTIPEDFAKDEFGNGNNASDLFEITVDQQKPTVEIYSDIPDYANTPCSVTITTSESVDNLYAEAIYITNGTLQILSKNSNMYTAYIVPIAQGLVTINIPYGAFTDLAHNENIASNFISYTYDTLSPEISLHTSEPSPTHAQSIHVDLTLTEPVIAFNADKLNITNASIAQGSFEGSNTDYSFDLIPQEKGNVSVTIDAGSIEDFAGNKNQNIASLSIVYDPVEYTLIVDPTTPGAYMPGHEFRIPVNIRYSSGMTSIGYEVCLPDNWEYVSVGGMDLPYVTPQEKLEFAWINNQIVSNTISFYYTVQISNTENANPEHITANVKYRYADGPEGNTDASFDVKLQSLQASHQVENNVYIAGEPAKIQIQIQELYESLGFNKYTAFGITVNIPVGWNFVSAEGEAIPYTKDINEGRIEFAWYDLKDFSRTNPIDLSYYIVSPDDSETPESISATLTYRFSNGPELTKTLDSIHLTPKDTIKPGVSITSSIPEYSNTAAWQITITFTEPVNDFEYNDIDVENGISTHLQTITQSVYVASISYTNPGEIIISIPSGIATDAAGLLNTQSIPYTRIYDIEPPKIVLRGDSPDYITLHDDYTDPGADVSDNACVTDQVSVSGSVNTSTENVYHLVYSVLDCAGNAASITRNVIVESFHPELTVNTIGGAYLKDNQFVLSATLNFTKGTNSIEYDIELPENWQFESESVWGDNPEFMPDSVTQNENHVYFGWNISIDTLDHISFVYTLVAPEVVSDEYELPVTVNYTYGEKLYKEIETVNIVKQDLIAKHTPKSNEYTNNGTVGIDVTIKLEKDANKYNNLSAVGLFVQLPDNWYYYRESNIDPALNDITSMQYPEKGDKGLLQFAWFDIQNNEISFTYDVKTPTETESETITATVQYRFANGPKRCIQLDDLTFDLSHRPSIARIVPENGETTNSGLITLTFTENVYEFDENDLIIHDNGFLRENSFTGNNGDLTYSFIIDVVSEGEFGFTIQEGSLKDIEGDTNDNITYTYVYDITPPTIEVLTSESSPTNSASIPVTVLFSEPVTGFTESDILLTNAEMDSFQGSNITYTFNIKPTTQDQISNLSVYIASSAVSDDAGNMNQASNTLTLTYQPFDVNLTCRTDAGSYMPGTDYFISVSINFTKGMTSIGYQVTYPQEWVFDSVWGNNEALEIRKQNNLLEFYWINMPDELDTLSFTYALRVPDTESTDPVILPVAVKYRHEDGVEKVYDATINAPLQKIDASHTMPNKIFVPEYAIPVNVNIQLIEDTSLYNKFSSIGLNVYVPDNWTFDHVESNPQSITPDVIPNVGDTTILQFAWFNINDLSNKPVNFTYYVKPSDTEYAEITATVNYRYANGMENSILLETLPLIKEELNIKHSCPDKFLDQLKVTTVIEYNGKQSSLKDMKLMLTIPDDWNISGILSPASAYFENNIIHLDTAYKESPLEIKYILSPEQSAQNIEIVAQMAYIRTGIASTDIELNQSVEPVKLTSNKTSQIVIQEVEGVESIAGAYYYTPDDTIKIIDTITSAIAITSVVFKVTLPQDVAFENASTNPETQNNALIFNVSSASPVTQLQLWYELKFSGNGQKEIPTDVKVGVQTVDIESPLVFYDNLRPEPVVNHHIADISNVSPMELTLTFSKPVNFENQSEKEAFALTNATIIDVITIQDKFIYKLTIMPKDGNVEIFMPETAIRDNLGTFNSSIEILSVIYDSQAPVIDNIEYPEATNLDMVPVIITFSEPVEGFDTQDLVIENGTAYTMNQQDNVYTFYIKPTGEGSVKIEIKPGVLQDKAGNPIVDSRIETFTYDTISPEIILPIKVPEKIDTIIPVALTITLTEPCPSFGLHNIIVSSGSVASYEVEGNIVTAIIQPENCGMLTIQISNIQDAAGNIQKTAVTQEILIDCTTYCGYVFKNTGNVLSDVAVNVSFPADDVYPTTKTDNNGFYALHLPKMNEKNYAFRFVKHPYITQTYTNESTPEDITTVYKLPPQTMKTIEATSYQYTIICSVTVDSQTPSSIVTVISANSDPANATSVATYNETDHLYYLYFQTRPLQTTISATLGIYSDNKELTSQDLIGHTLSRDLNMTKPSLPSEDQTYFENSIVVSKDDGGMLKLQSSTGESIAEIEMLPGSMSMNAKVKAETKDKRNSSFAAHSQLVDINTEADIIGELIVKIKVSHKYIYANILKGRNAVFWAKSHQAFIAGNVQEVPLDDILSVDQVPGYVRFKMRHLTTVGVGETGLRDPDAGQRRCFISTLQSVPLHPAIIFFVMTIIIGLFRNCISRR